MQRNSIILLGGDRNFHSAVFDNWTSLKTRYQYYLSVRGSGYDNIPWARLETDYHPQSRVTELLNQCANQDTLSVLGAAIQEKLPRVYNMVMQSNHASLFGTKRAPISTIYGKMFGNATRDDLDRICLAFGRKGCVGRGFVDLAAELEAQGILGNSVDMTNALSVLYNTYRPAYNVLAEYLGAENSPIETSV